MTKIKDAVGSNALSAKLDCAYIQILLNVKLAKTQGFTKIAEDGLCGAATIKAIRTFQQTIKMYHIDGRVDPDKHTFNKLIEGLSPVELTACWNKAVLTQNKGLIIDEQAKRAQAKSQPLPPKLVPKPDAVLITNGNNFGFPLDRAPDAPYWTEHRAFAYKRDGRKHAGCDLLMPPGSPIYAIADGFVRLVPHHFVLGAYAMEVTHGSYVARYSEIFPSAASPNCPEIAKNILPEIQNGKPVSKGQVIGYVGQVQYDIPVSMLHFEIYENSKLTGPLTVHANLPYKRRSDLANPTAMLDRARSSMPQAAEKLPFSTVQALIIHAKAVAATIPKKKYRK